MKTIQIINEDFTVNSKTNRVKYNVIEKREFNNEDFYLDIYFKKDNFGNTLKYICKKILQITQPESLKKILNRYQNLVSIYNSNKNINDYDLKEKNELEEQIIIIDEYLNKKFSQANKEEEQKASLNEIPKMLSLEEEVSFPTQEIKTKLVVVLDELIEDCINQKSLDFTIKLIDDAMMRHNYQLYNYETHNIRKVAKSKVVA